MSDVIVPCLKEPGWGGRSTSVCRPLWNGEQSPYMPVVAFGYDHPHTFEFLSEAGLAESGKRTLDVEREALRNLRLRKATWQPIEVKLGWFKKLKMLVCGDDFLAAERILDPGFMGDAQRQLKARGILVGVPRRGFLIAMNGEDDAKRVQAFATVVASQFGSGESAPISPMAFALKDGRIVGTLEAVAQVMVPAASMAGSPVASGRAETDEDVDDDDDGTGDPHAPYVALMVVAAADGEEELVVMAGGDDAERIGQAVVNAVAGGVSQQSGNPKFRGAIRVVILGMTPVDVRGQLGSLETHLQGIAGDLNSRGGSYRISMTFQEGGPFGT